MEIEDDYESRSIDLWLEFDPGDHASLAEDAEEALRQVFNRVSARLDYGVDWIG
ncbi:hypothetical protein ACWGQ4_22725 [Streptomyces sp. NPDC055721]|uniref:hypothetical protein n=1 Tax=Streptomyces sp. NPDC127132 TaxID=3345374 RepID=UPI003635F8DE